MSWLINLFHWLTLTVCNIVLFVFRVRRIAPTRPERRCSVFSPSITSIWPWERGSAPVTEGRVDSRYRGYSTRSCPASTRWVTSRASRTYPKLYKDARPSLNSWKKFQSADLQIWGRFLCVNILLKLRTNLIVSTNF